MDKKIVKRDYWKLAHEAEKIIAEWPKWKQEYHEYKKSTRKGLQKKEGEK